LPLRTTGLVNGVTDTDDDGIEKMYRTFGAIGAWVIAPNALTPSKDRPGTIVVDFATTGSEPATFTQGDQTLVSDANGVLSIDGGNPLVTDIILFKDQANPARNYIFEVTDVGSATTPWQMRVWPDFNEESEVFTGAFVVVQKGTTNAGNQYIADVTDPFVFGGSAINWQSVGGGGEVSASPNRGTWNTNRLPEAASVSIRTGEALEPGNFVTYTRGTPVTLSGVQVNDTISSGDRIMWLPGDGADATDETQWVNLSAAASGGSTSVGRGNALPADNTDYEMFILEGHTTLPNGSYYWSSIDAQWYQV